MTASALTAILIALVLAQLIMRLYEGQAYICPICKAQHEDEHSDDCPWRPRR